MTGAARTLDVDGATATLVGFARTLQAAGVPAGPDRVQAMVGALDVLDPARRGDVYWAGRLTLCGSADDLPRYDRTFEAYFSGERLRSPRRPPAAQRRLVPALALAPAVDPPAGGADGDALTVRDVASASEVLRHRDIASLDPADRETLNRLLAVFAMPGELRRTRRLRPSPRGRVDPARTMREMLRRGGETARLPRQRPRRRPRRVVLLVDVSGSMAPYADALLRFAHAASRRGATEVFTIGTRLTRVTRELGLRDPDSAMAAAAAAIPDWSGGTRLGELVQAFLDRWGQRGLARGAVVVVLSDGWERGDPALLGSQMARLGRLAHRVVWANPLVAREGYAPLAGGMAAALPYVDDFVAGHSLAALERLAAVVAGGRSGGRRA
ncbi:MAG: VWA domain-containing protein [Actinomycetota bacterium]|nr:VWA domain-containing protein [Actinomycetota bacterium]